MQDWLIQQPKETILNKLKKSLPDAFFYWYHAINIIKIMTQEQLKELEVVGNRKAQGRKRFKAKPVFCTGFRIDFLRFASIRYNRVKNEFIVEYNA